MTQLVYKRNLKKKGSVYVSSTILNHSQSALFVTDDIHMKDVLQLAVTIVIMASSAKKKNIWLQKFKNNKNEAF